MIVAGADDRSCIVGYPPPTCWSMMGGEGWEVFGCFGDGGGGTGGTEPTQTLQPAKLSPQQLLYLYAKLIQKDVKNGVMTDCQGLAAFAGDAAMLTSSTAAFVQAFGVLTPDQLATGVSPGMSWNTNPVYLNSGQPSGFDPSYQNTLPDNPVTGWNGDQGHHFAAFLQAGYLYGFGTASSQAWALEYWEGLNSGIMNLGDVNLGEAAAQIGAGLAAGTIKPGDVAGIINNTICQH